MCVLSVCVRADATLRGCTFKEASIECFLLFGSEKGRVIFYGAISWPWSFGLQDAARLSGWWVRGVFGKAYRGAKQVDTLFGIEKRKRKRQTTERIYQNKLLAKTKLVMLPQSGTLVVLVPLTWAETSTRPKRESRQARSSPS